MRGNILIIDDSPIERKIIGQAIKKRFPEINIVEVENGLNISEKLIKNNIHLCILDIMMPEKNGFEVLKEINDDITLKEIPVIVCTGISDKEAIEKALNLGAYDYFTKPLSEENLKISLPLKAKNAIDLMKRKEELKKKESEIYNLAYRNSITGLPNKNMFKETLGALINEDKNQQESFAMIYIDLDNFKEVNGAFGHTFGDRVLNCLSKRLKKNEKENCKVFNIGGDEFVFLVKDKKEQGEVEILLQKLLKIIKEPIFVDNNVFHISASGGVVFYPEHGGSFDELLKNVDAAMYRAKESEKGSYCFFDKSIGQSVLNKAKMQSNLRKALKEKEFLVYYQPQFNCKTVGISGFEALVRWHSSELGFVMPMSFIEAAEDSGLIIPIGKWVLETACEFVRELNEIYSTNYEIAVNISAIQIFQEDFVSSVMDILEKTGFPAKLLELEITESAFLNSIGPTVKKLEKLQEAGIKIALDDFGTGYSSLSYLRELPISTLKIDKSFIKSIFESHKNRSLTSTIIKMGHDLGMELVAEGVETEKELIYLTELNCDKIQGYYISKPIPKGELLDFLKNNAKIILH
ncbi:two-component system response regulator [Clostridium beijerinckii]|uniref:two-component system response regulator n=1 Tax=Clostridium beijerinckii TaxID=1520 RepID=UPI00156EEA6C|nr:GGDEF domain-containing response regulator [Clostridium beijerinckii]NRT72260.1 diguanylate cyclase (GGDEF)-like protein [Clostridium beijerinckii]